MLPLATVSNGAYDRYAIKNYLVIVVQERLYVRTTVLCAADQTYIVNVSMSSGFQ